MGYSLYFVCLELLLLFLSPSLNAQQFADLPFPQSFPGLSDSCATALNLTIACPRFLGGISIDNLRILPAQAEELCVATCRASLVNTRHKIELACKGTSDYIVYDDITYPATYIADRYLYTYNLACRKDPETGKFCDALMIEWLKQDNITDSQNCSPCLLGADQVQLNSPFGYDSEYAADFQSRTSSCGVSNYSFTVPPSYTISAPTPTASLPQICNNKYTVLQNDTCNSIALAKKVSTFSIVQLNGLYPDCSNLKPGLNLCLPESCEVYYVKDTDTCASIIASHSTSISSTQFLAWNPQINSLCLNLGNWRYTYICLSPPGGALGNVKAPASVLALATPMAVATAPKNADAKSSKQCSRWYSARWWENCARVSLMFGITASEFRSLNPGIKESCKLEEGRAYCVRAAGRIGIAAASPSDPPYYTLTSATYSTRTFTTDAEYPRGAHTSIPVLPNAPGTKDNCVTYQQHIPIPPIVDQSESTRKSLLTDYANTCEYISTSYEVSMKDLLAWNPSLSEKDCKLQSGYRYCVGLTEMPGQPEPDSRCIPVDKVPEGTISSCSCFTVVTTYDSGEYTCPLIASDFSISVDDIQAWNSWIGSDCDTGLYKGLEDGEDRPVCVRNMVPSSSTAAQAKRTGTYRHQHHRRHRQRHGQGPIPSL